MSNRLGTILTWGMLQFPDLIEQLPMMIASLDNNEYVNISKIPSNKLRDFLSEVMQYLPVELNEHRGWSRTDPDVLIGKYINNYLLTMGYAKPPASQSSGETAAVRWGAPRILHVLASFPDLRPDLAGFLQNLYDGNSVQLEDMDNESLREELARLLKTIGLVEDSDGALGLPDNANKESVATTLHTLIIAIECADSYRTQNVFSSNNLTSSESNPEEDINSTHGSHKHIVKEVSADIRNRGGANEKEEESSSRVIGPAIPSIAQLSEAQVLTKNYLARVDEEDDFGPTLAPQRPHDKEYLSRSVYAAPIGMIGVTMLPSITDKGSHQGGNRVGDSDVPESREEWMMTPGENKTIAELYGATGTMGNRKFQTGKSAKQLAESYSARSAALSARKRRFGEEDDEKGRNDEEAECVDDGRGPSLMDQHLQSLKTKKANSDTDGGRQAFDRERDVLSRQKMDASQASKLVEHAKELSSRFDKGSTQNKYF